MDGLCRQGSIDEAYDLFRTMERNPLDAKELIQEMVSEGFQADAATLSLMIELLPKKQLDHPVLRKLLSDSYAVSEEFRPKGLSPDTTSKD
ncbi:hypothetical protein LINGRAHAP2_LOCUS8997 [Linum grandiflorum]